MKRIPSTYNWNNLKRALRHPQVFLNEAQSVCEDSFVYPALNHHFEQKHGPGIDIFDKDWDTLIILDALRYDVLENINEFDCETNSTISQASTSVDFIRSNFAGKELYDTIYVTANGWIEELDQDPFFATKKTYTNFEQRHEMYAPEHVYELFSNTIDQYPNKKYIIHFMQPHIPYLGAKAEKLRERVSNEVGVIFKAQKWYLIKI